MLIQPGAKKNINTIEELTSEIKNTFRQILLYGIYENQYTLTETAVRMEDKNKLRKALTECTYGKYSAKIYVKDYIADILMKKLRITPEKLEKIISFSEPGQLTTENMYLTLMYVLQKQYKKEAFSQLLEENNLGQMKKDKNNMSYFEITEEELRSTYMRRIKEELRFSDKLMILTQKIYQNYKGNGIIDELLEMKVDGVSAGVSGIPNGFLPEELNTICEKDMAYNSIWVFFQGKTIHLSFLGFQTEKELIRVCKNVKRYQTQGQLSESSGFIVGERFDGSRVAVARPPFCESWVLFVRKFNTIIQKDIYQLITLKNREIPISFMKWLMKGCQVTAVTGEQGSGKTTLLMAMIAFIPPSYNLRIQELAFELHLRKIYPDRNIVSFRETDSVSGESGLNFSKKTDGTVTILGEVASNPVSRWLVEMSMVASLFTVFTHHAKTTQNLVFALRNSLLLEGGFHNEKIATEQVISSVHFDIHMKKDEDGRRYIERISEIIPKGDDTIQKVYGRETEESSDSLFKIRDIIVFDGKSYRFRQMPSEKARIRMEGSMSDSEKEEFRQTLSLWRKKENE